MYKLVRQEMPQVFLPVLLCVVSGLSLPSSPNYSVIREHQFQLQWHSAIALLSRLKYMNICIYIHIYIYSDMNIYRNIRWIKKLYICHQNRLLSLMIIGYPNTPTIANMIWYNKSHKWNETKRIMETVFDDVIVKTITL